MAEELNEALAAYADGPPDLEAARTLKDQPQAELLALIAELAERGQRAHLESLGRAGFAKPVKKAARAAAYKLKSAGVAGEGARDKGLSLRQEVSLNDRALVRAEGFQGVVWIATADLPEYEGFKIDCEPGPRIEKISQLETMSPSKLRRLLREYENEASETGMAPLLVDADMAVRLIDGLAEDVAAADPAGLPGSWSRVKAWRDEAVRHGADPDAADARRALTDELAAMPRELKRSTTKLIERPEYGVLLPDEDALDAFFIRVQESTLMVLELTEAQFYGHIDSLAEQAADAWLIDESRRRMVVRSLETNADLALSQGQRDAALQLLWVADQLAAGEKLPHEIELFREAFVNAVVKEAAWSEYCEAHGLATNDEPGSDWDGGLII